MYNCSKCSFNSEFHFSVATHEKLDHPLNLRREPYHCHTSFIEKRLCPEWDYDTLLKVDFDNHVRRYHDWGRNACSYEFHGETIKKQCDNCNFKTYSKFIWMLHVHMRGRDKNCLLLDQVLLITDVKNIYIGNETQKEFSTEIEASSTKTFQLFYCYNCSFKSKTKKLLNQHVRRTHNRTWFHCDKCSYKTHEKYSLKMHKLVKHMADDQIMWFKCAQCSYKSKWKASVSLHTKTKHTSNVLKCDQCSFTTPHKPLLKRHEICKHTTEDQIKWFKCEQCSYKGKLSYQLTQHIKRMHSSEDNKNHFKCDHCPYKTQMKQNLKKHEYYMHTPDDQIKWYKCEQCSYKGKLSSHLSSHIKGVHSSKDNRNLFKCDHCPFKTHMKKNLNMHKHNKHPMINLNGLSINNVHTKRSNHIA